MRIGGYVRVSSVGDRDRDLLLSPELQEDRIRGWCDAGGHELVDVRTDLDVSGGKSDRPNLIALIEAVEAGRLDGVIVAKLDRFARNLVHAVALIARINDAGGQFVSVADGFDTTTLSGKLVLRIMLSVAEFELDRYREGWREAREKMIEQGRHYSATPPLGYARGADGVLEPGPLADDVRELYRRRAQGESLSVLARWLIERDITTGRGGTPGPRYVRELIANPVYLGQARAGELVNDNAHAPLVDRVTWERANAAAGPQPAQSERSSVLQGLVRCQGCRCVMSAARSTAKDGAKAALRCRANHAAGRCPAPAFALEEQLLPLVEAEFFDRLGEMSARAAGDTEALELLVAERDQASRAFLAFRDDPAIIDALGPDFADGLRRRRAALEAAERAVAEASQPADDLADDMADVVTLRAEWSEIDVPRRRRMLARIIGTTIVRRPTIRHDHTATLSGRVHFLSPDDLPDDLPRPGRRPVGIRSFDDPTPAAPDA